MTPHQRQTIRSLLLSNQGLDHELGEVLFLAYLVEEEAFKSYQQWEQNETLKQEQKVETQVLALQSRIQFLELQRPFSRREEYEQCHEQ